MENVRFFIRELSLPVETTFVLVKIISNIILLKSYSLLKLDFFTIFFQLCLKSFHLLQHFHQLHHHAPQQQRQEVQRPQGQIGHEE